MEPQSPRLLAREHRSPQGPHSTQVVSTDPLAQACRHTRHGSLHPLPGGWHRVPSARAVPHTNGRLRPSGPSLASQATSPARWLAPWYPHSLCRGCAGGWHHRHTGFHGPHWLSLKFSTHFGPSSCWHPRHMSPCDPWSSLQLLALRPLYTQN